MTRSDAMKITARLGPKHERQDSPRERAREERKNAQVKRRRMRLQNKIRAVRGVRHAQKIRHKVNTENNLLRSVDKLSTSIAKQARGVVFRTATVPLKAVAVGVGWAMIAKDIGDAMIFSSWMVRRGEGSSDRLATLEDSRTQFGTMLLEAQTNADALAFVESDKGLLQAIGREGKMSGSTAEVVAEMKRMAAIRVQGADLISRDPHFDSMDSLTDKLLALIRGSELKDKADKASRLLRGHGMGKLRSVR